MDAILLGSGIVRNGNVRVNAGGRIFFIEIDKNPVFNKGVRDKMAISFDCNSRDR